MSGCGTGAAPPPPLIEMLVHVKPWAGQAAKKPTSPPAGEPWPDFFLCRNNLWLHSCIIMVSLCPGWCSFTLRGLHVSTLLRGRREHASPSAVATVWVLLWVWAVVLKVSPPATQCMLPPRFISLRGRSEQLKPGSPWCTCQHLPFHSFKCGRFICCEVTGYSITAGDIQRKGLPYVGCVHFFLYQYTFTTLIIVYFCASARAVTCYVSVFSSSHWKAERKNRLEHKMLLFGMSTSDAFSALLLGKHGTGSASRCPGCPLGSRWMLWLPVSACTAYRAILNYILRWLWGSINA